MTFNRGIFPYNGSKVRIIQPLSECFTFNDGTLIDVCGGAGSVTANIIVPKRIINEYNTLIAVIYKAFSNEKLCCSMWKIAQKINISRENYIDIQEMLNSEEYQKSLEYYDDEQIPRIAAYSYFVHFFARTGSDTSGEPTIDNLRRQRKWDTLMCGEFGIYMDIFNGVEVWNLDVCDVLKKIAKDRSIKGTATVYIDPPYLSSKSSTIKTNTKTYDMNKNEGGFGEDKHRQMLAAANDLPKDRFHVVVSNYENELYDRSMAQPEFAAWSKTFIADIPIMCGNGAISSIHGRKRAKEFIYANYKVTHRPKTPHDFL